MNYRRVLLLSVVAAATAYFFFPWMRGSGSPFEGPADLAEKPLTTKQESAKAIPGGSRLPEWDAFVATRINGSLADPRRTVQVKEKPAEKGGDPTPKLESTPELESMATMPKKRRASSAPRKPHKRKLESIVGESLSTQSFQLPINMLERLLRASMERKIGKVHQSTQHDVVADALKIALPKRVFRRGKSQVDCRRSPIFEV